MRDGRAGRRSAATLAGIGAVCALAVMALAALGIWQIERRAWKRDLIARVEARIHAEAVPAPSPSEWPALSAEADSYRRVVAIGRFRNDRETLTQAVTERGAGFWVMTPLEMADGVTTLVNRGFVPADRRDPATRAQGMIAGPTTITGLLRMSEPGGGFLRSNDPSADRWHSRDVVAIARARGLDRVAPYFIDADATPNPGGLPAGGLTIVAFSDNHLVYALTWLALAAMAAGFYGRLLLEKARETRGSAGL